MQERQTYMWSNNVNPQITPFHIQSQNCQPYLPSVRSSQVFVILCTRSALSKYDQLEMFWFHSSVCSSVVPQFDLLNLIWSSFFFCSSHTYQLRSHMSIKVSNLGQFVLSMYLSLYLFLLMIKFICKDGYE